MPGAWAVLPAGGTWLGERRGPGGTELRLVCRPCAPRGPFWLVRLELLTVVLPPVDCCVAERDVFSCRVLVCWAVPWLALLCWLEVC